MSEEKLKPCPFCGKPPEILKQHFKYRLSHAECVVIIKGGWFSREAFREQIKLWETRVT